MFWALCEHKCKSRVWVWTFTTHLKDSRYLRRLVSILSKRKQLNLASLFEYLWFNRRVWFIGHEISSAGIHQHYDTPNRHILFAGNGSFNCFPWHRPHSLWIIYCTQCKCERLVLFWDGVRCFGLILREGNQFWHRRHCIWSVWPRVRSWT